MFIFYGFFKKIITDALMCTTAAKILPSARKQMINVTKPGRRQ